MFVACTVVLATVDSVLQVADHFLKTDRAAAKLRKEAAAASTSASALTSSSSVSSSSASVSAHAGGGAKHGPAAAALQMAQFVGGMTLGFVWFWNDPGAVPIDKTASVQFDIMFIFSALSSIQSASIHFLLHSVTQSSSLDMTFSISPPPHTSPAEQSASLPRNRSRA